MSERQQVDPYGFVRLVGEPERLPPVSHHRFDGLSGLLQYTLTARTPLFVYHPAFARQVGSGHEEAGFPLRPDRAAFIPGSSLKGVIRSVAEAVEASCFTLFDGPEYRGRGITRGLSVRAKLPRGFERCSNPRSLCPACRIFGSLNRDLVHTGKVSVSDAVSPEGHYELMKPVVLEVLGTPKPEGRPHAYVDPERNEAWGRKFYRHRLDGVLTRMGGRRDNQNKTVHPVAPGSVFSFEVEYTDLRDTELKLLLYSLVLEPGLWHKVGLGKPIGLGSAAIAITRWQQVDRTARYAALGSGLQAIPEGPPLVTQLDEWLESHKASDAANLQDLRELWCHDHDHDVRYPSPRQW